LNHSANTVEKPEHETIVYKKTTVQAVNHDVIRSRRVVAMLKHDPMAEVFRMLRTKVLKQLRKITGTALPSPPNTRRRQINGCCKPGHLNVYGS